MSRIKLNLREWEKEQTYLQNCYANSTIPSNFNNSFDCFLSYVRMQANFAYRDGFPKICFQMRDGFNNWSNSKTFTETECGLPINPLSLTTKPKQENKTMSTSHYFKHIGTHFADLGGTPSHRRINTVSDLLQATILAHQTTAARFDEHQRNRPVYNIAKGKAWEAYKVWQIRQKLLHNACTDLSSLLVQVRNHPNDVLVSYRQWASPNP